MKIVSMLLDIIVIEFCMIFLFNFLCQSKFAQWHDRVIVVGSIFSFSLTAVKAQR